LDRRSMHHGSSWEAGRPASDLLFNVKGWEEKARRGGLSKRKKKTCIVKKMKRRTWPRQRNNLRATTGGLVQLKKGTAWRGSGSKKKKKADFTVPGSST